MIEGPIQRNNETQQSSVEISVVAPTNELTLQCELPASASRLEQAEWHTSLNRILSWLTDNQAFLQPRTHVTEVPARTDSDGWTEMLTGMLLPDSTDFLQHGLTPAIREVIIQRIHEVTQNGGALELDLGTISNIVGNQNESLALADWLTLRHVAELQKNLAPVTSKQATEIQVKGSITVADWSETPLNAASVANTKTQTLEQVWQKLKSESKTNQSCEFAITTETALFKTDDERQAAEAEAEKLSEKLQTLWQLSEAAFAEAFTHLETSAADWVAFAETIRNNQRGPLADSTVDTSNDYRKVVQAVIDSNPALAELLATFSNTESFGVMTPVWKQAFLQRIAVITHQPVNSPDIITTGLNYLARQCIIAQIKATQQPQAIRYDWNPQLSDSDMGSTTKNSSIPLRLSGKLSRQEYDPATADFVVVDPRKPILTKAEQVVIEKAMQLQANQLNLSTADTKTLAEQLAALVTKQQQSTVLLVRAEKLDSQKTLSTTTAKITPAGSSVSITIQLALQ